jgi:Ca2+/Na+ antiporter
MNNYLLGAAALFIVLGLFLCLYGAALLSTSSLGLLFLPSGIGSIVTGVVIYGFGCAFDDINETLFLLHSDLEKLIEHTSKDTDDWSNTKPEESTEP